MNMLVITVLAVSNEAVQDLKKVQAVLYHNEGKRKKYAKPRKRSSEPKVQWD